jgi:NIMA-interacting peptidyl-prolyl cis-trans isomerase 1
MKPALSTFFAYLCISACGAPSEKVASPEKTAAEPAGPEQECIAKANPNADMPADPPTRISVKHIVVKHVDSAGASSGVDRERGAACLRAMEAIDKLKGGADFSAVVADFSDEAGAATREGSLGEIKVEDVAPSFAAAAFALELGQVSYIVESKFGFHIIVRTD